MARCAITWYSRLKRVMEVTFILPGHRGSLGEMGHVSMLKTACDVSVWRQVVLVDVRELGRKSGNLHRKLLVERALRTKDQDNERYYQSLRARMERCACSPHAVLLAEHLSCYDSQR